MQKKEKNTGWSRDSNRIFEKFAAEWMDFSVTGKLPAYGSQDINYCLELQKNRLDHRHLKLTCQVTPADGADGIIKRWSDDRYFSSMECCSCRYKKIFYRNDRRVYARIGEALFYQTITSAHNAEAVSRDLYCCPNCGAVSEVGVLQQQGCPYCGTFFKISELFPKVTNFFLHETPRLSGISRLAHINAKLPVIFWMLLGAVLNASGAWRDGMPAIIFRIVWGMVVGALVGCFLWGIVRGFLSLCAFLPSLAQSSAMLVKLSGSQKKFEEQMKKYSPEFSYEYFSSKVVCYLKILIFSEDAGNLPIYKGEPLKTKKIVDASYTGTTELHSFRVEDHICQVSTIVHMKNIYDTGGRLQKKDNKYVVTLQKDISKPLDCHFSIKKIHCRGCGYSFDATKQTICPSCGKKYEIDGEDWVIVDIHHA